MRLLLFDLQTGLVYNERENIISLPFSSYTVLVTVVLYNDASIKPICKYQLSLQPNWGALLMLAI